MSYRMKGLRIKAAAAMLFALAATALWLPREAGLAAQTKVDFARDIQPIFAASCNYCHNDKKASGQLRLDVKALAMKGGISGAIIVAGDSKASRLIARIKGESGEAQMPLKADALKPEQIALIARWIDEGASWPESDGATGRRGDGANDLPNHWSYVKPRQAALPAVKNQAWVRNAVDAFILARLEKEGLRPSPAADKATLLRRVYLDVTGLPPTPPDLDAFIADTSPNAYEKVVDRLLASPAYGERWARPWLDLARYADSNGYEKDNLRVMWKYRDWVINALNADKPFDQFTIEQIAGDMLPNTTEEQRIATGFHRNTMINQEGGIDPYEARWETLVDRVNTTTTVWLGSTLGCAQCHNHKYDPFTQKDYYKLLAFFENTEYEIGYQSATKEEFTRWVKEPALDLPTPEQAAQRLRLNAEIEKLEADLKADSPARQAAQVAWEKVLLNAPQNWTALKPLKAESMSGAQLTAQSDQSLLVSGAQSESDVFTITTQTTVANITALRLEVLPDASLPQGGPGRDPYGNFLLTGFAVEAAPLNGSLHNKDQPIKLADIRVNDSAYKPEPREIFADKTDTRATDRPAGWAINATSDGEQRLTRQGIITAVAPFGFAGGTQLKITLRHQGGALCQTMGRFRLSVTDSKAPFEIVNVSARQLTILEKAAAQRTSKQHQDLADRYRSLAPEFKATRDQLEKLRDELKALRITSALVMQEVKSAERPATFLRERGNFMNKGEKLFAAVPAVLHALPESAPVNRLGLAQWLVSDDNPLVGRVTVNRFWEQLFGRGIVETSEDFGMQSAAPSHPELLDWLAVEFSKPTDKGGMNWSMKKLVRLLVTSATYRQSSAFTQESGIGESGNPQSAIRNPQSDDPYNRLLARGPRFRLEAEMLRDTVFAISGLLTQKVGGPSVMPLQPDGIWKAPYSSEKWMNASGADRYRRSLYTFARRSSPYPMMLNFDGISRESCVVRRTRTNTPLQALNMLNDEALFEAARALAGRIMKEGADTSARLAYGLRLCVARPPRAAELKRLTALYQQQLAYFQTHADESAKVVKQASSSSATGPELAAWTMVANVLLNLDETITK